MTLKQAAERAMQQFPEEDQEIIDGWMQELQRLRDKERLRRNTRFAKAARNRQQLAEAEMFSVPIMSSSHGKSGRERGNSHERNADAAGGRNDHSEPLRAGQTGDPGSAGVFRADSFAHEARGSARE